MQLAKLEKLAKKNQKSSLLTPVIASGSHMTPACFVFCFFLLSVLFCTIASQGKASVSLWVVVCVISSLWALERGHF